MAASPPTARNGGAHDAPAAGAAPAPAKNNRGFVAIGAGVLALAALMALGATQISGEAGYGGAGPNFLPWLVAVALAVLGVSLIVVALRHAAPLVEVPEFPPRWRAFAWVSLGLLLNAVLIEHVGFVASCALLFALGARGFRVGQDQAPAWSVTARDAVLGVVISLPVFWIFTKLLGLTLPALTRSGWI